MKEIFLWRLLIQNYSKTCITEKRQNKAKYLTRNSIRLKFLKKTSMPNPVKSVGYIKCHSSSSPSNSIRYNSQKICSWLRTSKTILKIRKWATFISVNNKPVIYKFFKDFTNERKKIYKAAVFSRTNFPITLKYKDHQWDLQTKFLQINIEEFC